MRVAVLASGSGSNFQALVDHFGVDGSGPVRVRLLVGSRPGIAALEKAERAGVPGLVLPDGARASGGSEEARFLLDALEDRQADLVVLAGWLRLVPREVVAAYRGRMLNIHPALLPAFGGRGMYGRRVHRAVLDSGARITGVTVHFVNEEYDRGTIAAQWPVPVLPGDDEATLAARVLAVEHRLLPAVVDGVARGEIVLGADGRCRIETEWVRGQRFLLEGDAGDHLFPVPGANA